MKHTMIAAALAAGLALGAGAAQAQQAPPPPREQTIRVTGMGEARARPDQAIADFAVETASATAQAAASENAGVMDRVIAALVRAGVPRDRIETSGYNVFPEYDPQPRPDQTTPTVRGYRVINTVTVTLDDVARVGAVIDAALGAGANRVNGVRFGLRDPQAFRQRAIDDAVRRARADAEALAASLNVGLGMVREAYTADVGTVQPVMYARMEMAADMAQSAPTPINPGEQTVRATVVVVYSIFGR
ncbi:SIMPL domain-containing protein [Longimicrobium sp.]|uniref:SIMPL domain-containing protein n=1 Tax=Longimicrobium sp. TaxID=2029185 RepID=UPI002E37CF0C|nr:SIMPL domain-containing protein [Longimicrobium sp.]HEX6040449.1 SIMPL domain-containing protein [Longimicrobium sp.]